MTIREGDVWRYPYLWARQDASGESEGRKSRPCAIAVKLTTAQGLTRAYFLAITSKEPSKGASALRIPNIERRRAGLAMDLELWIILDEFNVDILEQSFYFEPDARIGAFSPNFLKVLKAELLARIERARTKGVERR